MHARRLASIDALRGLAAFVVVLAHIVQDDSFVGIASSPRWVGLILDRLFSYGRIGVTLFFILSGFCIHLRWARAKSEGRTPQVRFISFWKHRFFRLYPPFFVAMAIYLAIQTHIGLFQWDLFQVYNVFTHLFMIHNFDERTIFTIDGVFWTLAIEEQLYLAYFLLLYVRGRWGWSRALMLCLLGRACWFALAFVVNRGGQSGYRLPHEGGCLSHWFVWALGALTVEASVGLIKLPEWTNKFRYAVLFLALAASCDLITEFHLLGAMSWRMTWLIASPLWGAGFFIVVNRLVAAEAGWRAVGYLPLPIVFFASLGLFSYSTYLMHNFVLKYVNTYIFGFLGLPNSILSKLIFLPMCFGMTWIFFVCVERHFIRRETIHPHPRPMSAVQLDF